MKIKLQYFLGVRLSSPHCISRSLGASSIFFRFFSFVFLSFSSSHPLTFLHFLFANTSRATHPAVFWRRRKKRRNRGNRKSMWARIRRKRRRNKKSKWMRMRRKMMKQRYKRRRKGRKEKCDEIGRGRGEKVALLLSSSLREKCHLMPGFRWPPRRQHSSSLAPPRQGGGGKGCEIVQVLGLW